MQVGLTGGIGSGKSEVARILESLGALIVDTDVLARVAVAPESEGLDAIAVLWPQVVQRGQLDRAALAEIVFADPSARDRLNGIVHPIVRGLAKELAERALPGQLAVHVVPLLFETAYVSMVEKSILVVAPDATRVARVVARDGVEVSHVEARMSSQIAVAKARARADYVIENDSDLAHLREQTREVYAALTR